MLPLLTRRVEFSKDIVKEYAVELSVKRWLKSVRKLFSEPRIRAHRRRPTTRLLLEGLESRLMPAPIIATIAGTSSYGYNGDGIAATSATLYLPFGTAVDASGNVFIADSYNSRIREVVRATGNIATVAGTAPSATTATGSRPFTRISTTRMAWPWTRAATSSSPIPTIIVSARW